jgi:hypothetical protein
MAFSLKFDMPSQDVTKKGTAVLGDPTKATIGKIYLYAALVSLAVVLVGAVAMPIRSRLAVIVPCVAASLATLVLVLSLSTWRDEHTARYPLGVDLIPKSDPGDLILRGEWELNAYTTARQIGFWTVAMSAVAIVLTVALEMRRRRGIIGPPVPPPPEVAAGEPQVVPQAPQLP